MRLSKTNIMPKAKMTKTKVSQSPANPAVFKGTETVSVSDTRSKRMSATVRVKIDPGLKANAETVLSHLGIKPSEAIRIFYNQITLAQGLPFPVEVPNAKTQKAIEDADAGQLTHHHNSDEMFKNMGI